MAGCFSEFYTGKDIADILVREEDLKVYERVPKEKFEPLKIKAYDMVELLVEDNKYVKYGVHKGDRGCVMDDYGIQGYIEVDFSGIDENGNFYGDCISVKAEDLKVIN